MVRPDRPEHSGNVSRRTGAQQDRIERRQRGVGHSVVDRSAIETRLTQQLPLGVHRRTVADGEWLIGQQLIYGGTREIAIGNASWLSSLTIAVD